MEQRDISQIGQRLGLYFKWSSPAKYQFCFEGWGLIEIQNMGPKVGLQIRFHGPCRLILKRESSYLHFVNKSSAVKFSKPKYAPNTGKTVAGCPIILILINGSWCGESLLNVYNVWRRGARFFPGELYATLLKGAPLRGAICCLRVTLSSSSAPLLKPHPNELQMKYNN